MATLHSVSSLNRTRTRGKLNRSALSQSMSQRRYKNNPGGKTRKNRIIPPESEPVTEDFDNIIETPPVPSAPQPTPVDPISESELPSVGTNAGNTPRKATHKGRGVSLRVLINTKYTFTLHKRQLSQLSRKPTIEPCWKSP